MQEEAGLVISCSLLPSCSLGYEHGQSERQTKDAEHFCQKKRKKEKENKGLLVFSPSMYNTPYNNDFLHQMIKFKYVGNYFKYVHPLDNIERPGSNVLSGFLKHWFLMIHLGITKWCKLFIFVFYE